MVILSCHHYNNQSLSGYEFNVVVTYSTQGITGYNKLRVSGQGKSWSTVPVTE